MLPNTVWQQLNPDKLSAKHACLTDEVMYHLIALLDSSPSEYMYGFIVAHII